MIKITIRKDTPKSNLKWWVEGFENKTIKDDDIEEILSLINIAKDDIENKMKIRKEIEGLTGP